MYGHHSRLVFSYEMLLRRHFLEYFKEFSALRILVSIIQLSVIKYWFASLRKVQRLIVHILEEMNMQYWKGHSAEFTWA